MGEPFDIYSDAFMFTITPWGANMSFQLREAHPAPTSPSQSKQLGTVRMSNEHLKTMIFMLRQRLLEHERGSSTQIEVPTDVLSQLGIAREDWDSFWDRGES